MFTQTSCSQVSGRCRPSPTPGAAASWSTWHDFEVAHGNEDTFREMLRVKRSVEAARSAQNYVADTLLKADKPLMSDAEANARLAVPGRRRFRVAAGGGTRVFRRRASSSSRAASGRRPRAVALSCALGRWALSWDVCLRLDLWGCLCGGTWCLC